MTSPIRKLPKAAAIYATGDFLIRAANFFILPLLTHYLSRREYGILGGVTPFTIFLGLALQLNLNVALMRFYSEFDDEQKRRQFTGTLMLFTILWSLAITILLNVTGPLLLDHIYREVRFEPYLRIGTWITLFNTMGILPLAMLQMQQRPGLHRLFALGTFAANTGFTLFFVVYARMGAYGALLGQLAGGGISAIAYLVLMHTHVEWTLVPGFLRTCLGFSLPLLVYALVGWFMDSSNRVFIERFISLDQLGLFNLASQFAMILGYLIAGIGLAFTPLFYETVKLPDGREILARFGVLYIAAALGLTLVVALLAGPAIQFLTEPRFHDASRIVPILTLTQALTAFWHLIVHPIMLKEKTKWLMIVTTITAAVSVGLNFWLVPAYGVIGAAATALFGNILLNTIVFVLSRRIYFVPYNYRRMAVAAVLALGLYLLASISPSLPMRVILAGVYPALLLGFGVVNKSQIRNLIR